MSGHAFHISRVWGSRHGGSFYSQTLVEELLKKGWNVTLLVERFADGQSFPERVVLHAFFQRSVRVWWRRAMEICRLWKRLTCTPGALVIVQGDLPRLTYLILQFKVPLIFIRQDGILSCPANNRFLLRSRSVCCKPLQLSCLWTHRKESCLGHLRVWQQLGRLLFRTRDSLMLRWMRYFVANSRYIARIHHRQEVVLYPPRLSAFQGHASERDLQRLVFCGRLEEVKGAGEAIRILSLLPEGYHLEILGSGPERGHLGKLARDLGLASRVVFHDWVDGLTRDKCLASSGALLMPSLWDEAFGMAGLEAFGQGTPVVGYDVGGISEWCREPAGLLVPCGDVRGAAAAVRQLTDDPVRWASHSRAARRVAEADFPVERFARDLDRILAQVTKKSHEPQRHSNTEVPSE